MNPSLPSFSRITSLVIPFFVHTDLDFLPHLANYMTGQPGTVDIGPFEF